MFFATGVICVAQAASPKTAWTDETGLRTFISKLELPSYPKEDVRQGTTGVAVAQVTLDSHCNVKAVEVLQAPSSTISSAVRDALAKSTFAFPDKSYSDLSLTGKITFYFLKLGGKYVVRNPQEVPQYDDLRRGEHPLF
jgi:hypothetical protein